MPQPRKASPRRRDSRRSRSFSPRPSHSRRRSRSRSPKDRRHSRSRSRSPVRKRSPPQRRQRSPKHYSPPRQRSRSPQRKRSRTPQRKRSRTPQRKRSRTPQRKRSWSPQRKRSQSPVDRSYPVKRQADSSGKRQSYRSRSPSPAPVKRSKDGRSYQEESPDEWRYLSSHKQHSPSPRQRSSSPYGGKMYADQSPSSSKRPLFPAAEKKRRGEIESVKIVDKVRKEKLDKRFQTLEQLAQGHFEFEENITIGIHRGPSHMELDEDVPVDYDINLKTFVMIFPKKDYQKAIFDRDEIKAFHHDDILDEEAYVEKRTITVKPTDKQKQKWSDETEYKITIGGDQCGYGDRRRVQDSGSRSRGSRSSHGESDVKVRLDPKPDPRYEKLYREHQRQEDESLMQENIQRNPNDLRYNLMRKNSTGDRGNRDRDRGSDRDHGRDSGMVDARSKIEARRQESHSGSRRDSDRKDIPRDGRDSRHSPPPSSIERKKPVHVKTDLPDFKNRPVKFLDRLGTSSTSEDLEIPPDEALRRLGGADTGVRTHWGHCEICNVPVNSAEQATEHVYGAMHRKNEHARKNSLNSAFGPSRKMSCYDDDDDARSSWRDREGHRHHGDAEDEGEDYPNAEEFEERERSDASFSKDETSRDIKKKYVWIFGTGEMKQCMAFADKRAQFGLDLGLARKDVSFVWVCNRGMLLADVLHLFQRELSRKPAPSIVILHVGGNDLQFSSVNEFLKTGKDTVDTIKSAVPSVKLVWSQMLPRWTGQDIASKLNRNRIQLEEDMACYVLNCGGCYIRYPMIMLRDRKLYKKSVDGDLFLDFVGLEKMLIIIKGSIMSIGRGISIIPDLKGLAPKINRFVRKNIQNRTKFLPIQKRV